MDRNTQIGVKLINKIKKPEGELKRGFASLDKKSSPSKSSILTPPQPSR
jgi:hypothetical protein